MTKAAAVYQFFASFDIPAYDVTRVPDNAEFPYLTYEYGETGFNEGEFPSAVNIYYLGSSNVAINAKVDELAAAIGRGGRVFKCDGGRLWIKRGSPWVQTMADSELQHTNRQINRRYINVTIEYLV